MIYILFLHFQWCSTLDHSCWLRYLNICPSMIVRLCLYLIHLFSGLALQHETFDGFANSARRERSFENQISQEVMSHGKFSYLFNSCLEHTPSMWHVKGQNRAFHIRFQSIPAHYLILISTSVFMGVNSSLGLQALKRCTGQSEMGIEHILMQLSGPDLLAQVAYKGALLKELSVAYITRHFCHDLELHRRDLISSPVDSILSLVSPKKVTDPTLWVKFIFRPRPFHIKPKM